MTLFSWSKTPADNDDADVTINAREGWSPRVVNNAVRGVMAAVAKWRDDLSGNLVTGGTSTAYTLTTNQGFTSLSDGLEVSCRMSATNGANPTLNVDGLGARAIAGSYGKAIPARALAYGSVCRFTYNSTDNKWIFHGYFRGVEVGTVVDFAGATAPSLWLMCYGQAVSRTTYAELYDVIGTAHGAGDGSTTFNLPDCRGRVVAGKDDMGGSSANRLTNQSGGLNGATLGATGGAETHELTEGQLPAHTHGAGTYETASGGAHTHNLEIPTKANESGSGGIAAGSDSSAGNVTVSAGAQSSGAHTHTISGSSGSTGSGTAHNNVQPTIVFNKIIFAGV